MKQITEDYVSFETAKLLKEKGFKGECFAAYNGNGKLYKFDEEVDDNIPDWSDAPTLQMAIKWLREEEQLYIMLDFERPSCIEYKIYKYESEIGKKDLLYYNYVDSYKQACETAIKYCLENLI